METPEWMAEVLLVAVLGIMGYTGKSIHANRRDLDTSRSEILTRLDAIEKAIEDLKKTIDHIAPRPSV